MTSAYPLSWPPGWPRTDEYDRRDGKFNFRKPGGRFWTFAEARNALLEELRRLGAQDIIVSTNFKPDRNGIPVEGSRRPPDQGVAVYFTLERKPKTMARDTYLRIEENMRALTLTIEAMRAIERHGGGQMMSRAFEGFTALPPPMVTPPKRDCWAVLDLLPTRQVEVIRAAYRALAKKRHPDVDGGSAAAMAELQAAYEEALKEVNA